MNDIVALARRGDPVDWLAVQKAQLDDLKSKQVVCTDGVQFLRRTTSADARRRTSADPSLKHIAPPWDTPEGRVMDSPLRSSRQSVPQPEPGSQDPLAKRPPPPKSLPPRAPHACLSSTDLAELERHLQSAWTVLSRGAPLAASANVKQLARYMHESLSA